MAGQLSSSKLSRGPKKPANIFSMRDIKETIDAHSEIIAPGVKGINFMKPDAPVNTHSAVYQAILEEEEAKSKGGTPGVSGIAESLIPQEKQYHEVLRQTSTSPNIQSCAFRRLQVALDGVQGGQPMHQPMHQPMQQPMHQPMQQPMHQPSHQPMQMQEVHGISSISPPSASGGFPSNPVTRHVEGSMTSRPPPERGNPSSNVCFYCRRTIVGVFCRVNDKNLHPDCFRCATCGSPLKNVGHFTVDDKFYCEVHTLQALEVSKAVLEASKVAASMSQGPFFPDTYPTGRASASATGPRSPIPRSPVPAVKIGPPTFPKPTTRVQLNASPKPWSKSSTDASGYARKVIGHR